MLLTVRTTQIVDFPAPSFKIMLKVFPLPLFYVGNLVSGFIGTKRLSLPMFTVLRRFSIVMTMIGEFYVLNMVAPLRIVASVFAMVGGALIAAVDDLGFDFEGYTSVLINDFFTAANGVYTRKKLDAKDLGKYGLLFYNAMFMLPPLLLTSIITGDLQRAINFVGWTNPIFVMYFFFSCVMGFALMYSTLLCTAYNSALTTTIVGCLKNIMTTYIGMCIGGDYIFSVSNFIGLNISMIGSLFYSYLTFIVQRPNNGATNVKKTKKTPETEILIEPQELKVVKS
ncbi:UDP-N-acetylglucosamine/UDP-glucose/GDP-mannose transporter-like isoform X2 [Varroa jacobsoni]|uniref:Sugar phosphate transporter domain-containing protein n=1 Tax=Varroa destructor TaxID=109461 RepID=A0A7M7KDG6_VARDE|nr:UDP-N-acetylglucosamine/UDP-glucose/GDP-mannose transporter-like isoform X2 [Varroa destructor]XP_022687666.1 UDP-N-acetylglucosamine/UDP-glucose/GDP-mannose transporter-like isoform X2 [Varroa jacobsoni]